VTALNPDRAAELFGERFTPPPHPATSLWEALGLEKVAYGFPRYTVTPLGIVVQRDTRKVMAQHRRNGYALVKLTCEAGARHWVPVHTLILQTFHGPRPTPRHHGAHLDGDKRNNTWGNLAWKTPEENEADKKAHGTAPRGRLAPVTPRVVVRAIVRARRAGDSYSAIARRHGMHRTSVQRICDGVRRGTVKR